MPVLAPRELVFEAHLFCKLHSQPTANITMAFTHGKLTISIRCCSIGWEVVDFRDPLSAVLLSPGTMDNGSYAVGTLV